MMNPYLFMMISLYSQDGKNKLLKRLIASYLKRMVVKSIRYQSIFQIEFQQRWSNKKIMDGDHCVFTTLRIHFLDQILCSWMYLLIRYINYHQVKDWFLYLLASHRSMLQNQEISGCLY